jgi:acetyltransferase-like isoleucine patch superfamily enzyme
VYAHVANDAFVAPSATVVRACLITPSRRRPAAARCCRPVLPPGAAARAEYLRARVLTCPCSTASPATPFVWHTPSPPPLLLLLPASGVAYLSEHPLTAAAFRLGRRCQVGDVEIMDNVNIGYHAVVRGDRNKVTHKARPSS